MRRLRDQRDSPWIACGDFNEVLCQEEHAGPRDRLDSQIKPSRSVWMTVVDTSQMYL
jgi:hypothetical protein